MGIRKKKPAALAAADISCPGCGSVNSVRVAGIYESPRSPHKWYCRCDHCRKGFVPKPKGTCELLAQPGGEDEVAHGDKIKAARETLPQAEFERMIRQGMTDPEVADVTGLDVYLVKRLKQEYKLTGFVGKRNRFTIRKEREDMIAETMPADSRAEKKMTISAAIEHQANMAREAESIKQLIEHAQGLELAPGVLALLKGYQEGCNTSLERVTKAFETVEITF